MSDLLINKRITSIANDLLNSQGRFIEAVRSLSALRFEVSDDGHDPDFMLFLSIDSETDHLPPASAFSNCSHEWITKCAKEEREAAEFYKLQIRAACERLIERFSA